MPRKTGLPKRPPTEEWLTRYIAKLGGVFGGSFSHPLLEDEEAAYYALETPPGMMRTEAIWHRKRSFVYFLPWRFTRKPGKDINVNAAYEEPQKVRGR